MFRGTSLLSIERDALTESITALIHGAFLAVWPGLAKMA
jgi:hypothetical protein